MKRVLFFGIWSLIGVAVFFGSSIAWVVGHGDAWFEGKADCAVVFGAAVWRDDRPSHALYDRTVTALKMYQRDQVDCLVFSGGASTQGAHEVDVMKKLALEVDIPESDLVLDYEGVNTLATIKQLNTRVAGKSPRTSSSEGADLETSYVLVSNDFHLGRIKLLGMKFLDVPFEVHAAEYHYGRYWKEQFFFWREVVAMIWYGVFVW